MQGLEFKSKNKVQHNFIKAQSMQQYQLPKNTVLLECTEVFYQHGEDNVSVKSFIF